MEILKTQSEAHRFADLTAIVFATGFGAGFVPRIPGTAGAIVGVGFYVAMEWLEISAYFLHVILFFLAVGVWAAWRVEHLWGHDSQRIVMDEVVGQMITFAYMAGRTRPSAIYIVAGFALFRVFDIFKPFPLRWMEGFRGGYGVMADDIGAGLYALGLLTATSYII